MVCTIVHVYVKEDSIEEFRKASIENHKSSIQEEGNCRFDILQDKEDKSYFMLYEVYETEVQAKAHKETEHYLKWRETVAPMMAKDRKGQAVTVHAP